MPLHPEIQQWYRHPSWGEMSDEQRRDALGNFFSSRVASTSEEFMSLPEETRQGAASNFIEAHIVPPADIPIYQESSRGLMTGLRGILASGYGTVAKFTGSESRREKLLEDAAKLESTSRDAPISVPTPFDIESVGDASRWVAGAGPMTGTSIALFGLSATIGGLAGAAAGSLIAPGVGTAIGVKFGSTLGGKIGAWIGSVGLGGLVGWQQYSGGIYSHLREEGVEHEAAKRTALVYGLPAGLISIIGPAVASRSIMGGLGRDYVRSRARRAALGAAAAGPFEGTAEYGAEAITIAGERQHLVVPEEEAHKRKWTAGITAGLLMGVPMGAVGGGGRPTGTQKTFIDALQQTSETFENHPAIYSVLTQYLDKAAESGQLSEEEIALQAYLKGIRPTSNRKLKKAEKDINRIAAQIARRDKAENLSRFQELTAKENITGEEALEIVAIFAQSKESQESLFLLEIEDALYSGRSTPDQIRGFASEAGVPLTEVDAIIERFIKQTSQEAQAEGLRKIGEAETVDEALEAATDAVKAKDVIGLEYEFVSKSGNRYTKKDGVWYNPQGERETDRFKINAAERGKRPATPVLPATAERDLLHQRFDEREERTTPRDASGVAIDVQPDPQTGLTIPSETMGPRAPMDLLRMELTGRRGRLVDAPPAPLIETPPTTMGPRTAMDRLALELQGRPGGLRVEIDAAAHEAATSPVSPAPAPTEAQKKAGNYKKGHVSIQGLEITIENPEGSERSGTAPDGTPWSVTMQHHYGYFKRSEGKDGDQIDVIVGENPESQVAYIVDQVDPETGKFDEHKTLIGFNSEAEAREGYLANYEEGWQGLGAITEMPIDDFKEWVRKGRQTKPVAPIEAPTAVERAEPIPEAAPPAEVAPVAPIRPAEAVERVIDSVNPVGSVFADYTPQERMAMKLGDNITTLDKTMGKSPDDTITIYRGALADQAEIVPGDFVTTNKQLAKDYAGTGVVLEKRVKLSEVLDDTTEPLGEEYIYRPPIEKAPVAEVERPTVEKQPWDMTREEFERSVPVTPISKTEASVPVEDGGRFRFDVPPTVENVVGYARRRVIQRALSEGRTVPPEVLADYPDLKPAEVKAEISPLKPDARLETSEELSERIKSIERQREELTSRETPSDVDKARALQERIRKLTAREGILHKRRAEMLREAEPVAPIKTEPPPVVKKAEPTKTRDQAIKDAVDEIVQKVRGADQPHYVSPQLRVKYGKDKEALVNIGAHLRAAGLIHTKETNFWAAKAERPAVAREDNFDNLPPAAFEGKPISTAYIAAKKRPDGKWRLFARGTRNEIFPGELFNSAAEARNYYKAMWVKAGEATERTREQRKREAEFAYQSKRQALLRARDADKAEAADGFTLEDAERFISDLEAAPGDDVAARQALVSKYPDLAPEVAPPAVEVEAEPVAPTEAQFNSILQFTADTPKELRAADVARVMDEARDQGVADEFKEWLLSQELNPRTKDTIEAWDKEVAKPPVKAKPPPAEQKSYILAEIDKAIKTAPEHVTEGVEVFSASADLKNQIDAAETENRLAPSPHAAEITEEQKIERIKAQEEIDAKRHRLMTRVINEYVTRVDQNPNYITIKVPGYGSFRILNEKEALNQFKKQAEKYPVKEVKPKKPGIPVSKPIAARKELIGKLFKITGEGGDQFFSDGSLIVRGKPPARAKYGEAGERRETSVDRVEDLLGRRTSPAKILFYGQYEPGALVSTSEVPVPDMAEAGPGDHYQPFVVLESDDGRFVFSQARFNVIRNRFPNAEIGINADAPILVAYDKGKPVAVLMPFGKSEYITKGLNEVDALRSTPLFSRHAPGHEAPARPVKALAVKADVNRAVRTQFKGLKGLVEVVQSEADLPAAALAAVKEQGMEGRYNGFKFRGMAYIVADNLSSRDAGRMEFIEQLLGHEGRHWAFQQIFPNAAERKSFMDQVAETYKTEVDAWLEAHEQTDKAMAAEEVLASQVQEGRTGALIDRFIAKVAEWLRKIFPGMKVTRAEARNLIERAEDMMVREAEAGVPVGEAVPRYQVRETDADYLAAVERGDMETAREMVDEAAKAAGYNVGPVWHWTDYEFTAFDVNVVGGMAHFGTQQAASDRARGLDRISYEIEDIDGEWYVYPDGGPMSGEGQGPFKTKQAATAFVKSQPKLIDALGVYLNIQNPLRVPDFGVWTMNAVREHLHREGFFSNKEADQIWDAWEKSDLDGYNAFNKALKKHGHDGLEYINEQEDVGSISYVALTPEQIKSADAVTYDDAGNVIPLSQRFDVAKDDLRYQARGFRAPHRPLTEEGGAARIHDLTPAFGEDIYSEQAVQYFGTGETALDKKTVKILQGLRGKPEADVTVYRAVPADHADVPIAAGEWVTVNREYAEQHGEAYLEEEGFRVTQHRVKAKDLTTNADSFHEQGYYPATEAGIRFMRRDENLIQTGDAITDAKAQALIKKLRSLYTAKGAVSEAKGVRLLDRYETLIQTLKDDKKDIYAKQKALEDHIKKNLPPSERGKVIQTIKRIAMPSTQRGRERMLQQGIQQVEDAHQRYEKRRQIALIDKMIKSKKPKRTKQGVPAHRSLGPEGNRLFALARAARSLTQEEGLSNALEIMERIQSREAAIRDGSVEANKGEVPGEPTRAQAEKLMMYQMFSGLENKKAEDIQTAAKTLNAILGAGRVEFSEAEKARKLRMEGLRETAIDEFSGREGERIPESVIAERSNRSLWRRIAQGINEWDTRHQSWEFLLDKLTLDKKSGTLQGATTEYFARLVFDATENKAAGVTAHQNILHAKLVEIYGIDGRSLSRKLQGNSKVNNASRVTRNTPHGRVTIPLSQNMGYKLWQLFQQPSIQTEMTEYGLDSVTLKQVEKFLDPKVKEWAKWQIEEFFPMYREGVNEVYKQLFYVEMPNILGYTPISRVYHGRKQDDPMLEGMAGYASLFSEISAIKSRTKNSRGFNLLDGDGVLLRHIHQLEHFKAFGVPMREMRSVLGSEAVQNIIKQHHSFAANRTFQNFIDAFASEGRNSADTIAWIDKLRANFTKSVIGANPVVFMKQLASIPAYAMDIPASSFISGFAYSLTHPATAYKTLMQSPTMRARYRTGFERDIKLSMERNENKTLSGTATFSDHLMLSTKLGDKLAIIAGGYSVYSYHLRKNLEAGMSNEKAHKEALVQFDRSTKRSQQAADVMDMAEVQRMGGSIGKLFTMFLTAPLAYYRNAGAGLRNLSRGRGSKAENAKRFFIAWVVLPSLFQWVASGFDWEWDKQGRAALVGPLTGMFVVRDLIEAASLALFRGDLHPGMGTPPPLSSFTLFSRALRRFGRMIEDGWNDEQIAKAIEEMIEFAGNVSGIPTAPIKRVATGVRDAATGETEHPVRRSLGYTERALEKD